MSRLAAKFLNLKTRKLLKKKSVSRGSIGYKEAETVGIMFSVTDREKHNRIKSFIKKLETDGKNVYVLCFLEEGKENFDFIFDYFTANDFSFFGNPASQSIQLFIQKKFDFLFVLDTTPNIYIENLLAKSATKCRVGCYNDNKGPFYEFMIKIKQGGKEDELIDQIYHYLKFLN